MLAQQFPCEYCLLVQIAGAQMQDHGVNLWDDLFGALGDAISDVRERVVFEPWFGRGAASPASAETRSVAEELGWTFSSPNEIAPARDLDHGIDR